jgi:hypothetical protein
MLPTQPLPREHGHGRTPPPPTLPSSLPPLHDPLPFHRSGSIHRLLLHQFPTCGLRPAAAPRRPGLGRAGSSRKKKGGRSIGRPCYPATTTPFFFLARILFPLGSGGPSRLQLCDSPLQSASTRFHLNAPCPSLLVSSSVWFGGGTG